MTAKTWDIKSHLRTEEDIRAYLVAVREIGDARLSALAENDAREARIALSIAKAKGKQE